MVADKKKPGKPVSFLLNRPAEFYIWWKEAVTVIHPNTSAPNASEGTSKNL